LKWPGKRTPKLGRKEGEIRFRERKRVDGWKKKHDRDGMK